MSWLHLEDTQPKARKDHDCFLCGNIIPKGTKHISRSGIGDDGPERIHMHIECELQTKTWKEEDWLAHDPVDFKELMQKKSGTSFGFRLSGVIDMGTGEHKITAAWWQPIADFWKRY